MQLSTWLSLLQFTSNMPSLKRSSKLILYEILQGIKLMNLKKYPQLLNFQHRCNFYLISTIISLWKLNLLSIGYTIDTCLQSKGQRKLKNWLNKRFRVLWVIRRMLIMFQCGIGLLKSKLNWKGKLEKF